jgi:hypothetical protein
MTDWNQYARDVQAASNAAHNKDQKRIKELESKLAKAEKERDTAREYAGEARKREMAAEDARINVTDKLALMIFERDEVMMFERDEAWKRAAHSEKMWGEAEVKLAKAVEVLKSLHHAVCGETGFASAVRNHSGKAYPWEPLDIADKQTRSVLAELEKTK